MRSLLTLLVACAIGGSAGATPGWKRASQEFEKPKPVPAGSACTFTFDSPKTGLAFTQTCTSPDKKTVTKQSCRLAWRSDADLSTLRPGQVVTFTGSVTHVGSTGNCAAYVNLPPSVSAFFISNAMRATVTKSGKVTVPGPGKNPRTGKYNPLELVVHLTGGNETRFLTLRLRYEWTGP